MISQQPASIHITPAQLYYPFDKEQGKDPNLRIRFFFFSMFGVTRPYSVHDRQDTYLNLAEKPGLARYSVRSTWLFLCKKMPYILRKLVLSTVRFTHHSEVHVPLFYLCSDWPTSGSVPPETPTAGWGLYSVFCCSPHVCMYIHRRSRLGRQCWLIPIPNCKGGEGDFDFFAPPPLPPYSTSADIVNRGRLVRNLRAAPAAISQRSVHVTNHGPRTVSNMSTWTCTAENKMPGN